MHYTSKAALLVGVAAITAIAVAAQSLSAKFLSVVTQLNSVGL